MIKFSNIKFGNKIQFVLIKVISREIQKFDKNLIFFLQIKFDVKFELCTYSVSS